jgi:integrase
MGCWAAQDAGSDEGSPQETDGPPTAGAVCQRRRHASPQSASINSRALAAVSAIFGHAADNGYVENNPATGVKATGPANHGPSRLPYSPADLKAIFSSAVFMEGERPAGGAGEAAKWLPLLALFTGARLEELGRLEVADVREEQDVTYLFIHGDGEGRRVKTRGSRRRVPVHPELARLGFLTYVGERKRAGDKRLFPALVSKRSQITAAFSTWWGRYTGRLGITDDRKVFHSFRHSVKRGLREAGVDPALSDALQGHSAKDVAGRYGLDEEGSGFSLPVLHAALSRLTYPGLDLSRLEPLTPASAPN